MLDVADARELLGQPLRLGQVDGDAVCLLAERGGRLFRPGRCPGS